MEKYVDILQNILTKTKVNIPPNYLDDYFEIIDKNGYLEVLNNNDTWNAAFAEIEDGYQIKKYQFIHNPDMVTELLKIISAMVVVEEKEKKKDLFPLITYLEQKNILCQYLIDNGFFEDIESNIFKILSSINIQYDMHDISELHWELESFENYKKGIEGKNIELIYKFISAFEEGGGFIPDGFINLVVFVLYEISYKKLIDILDQKEDVLTIINLVNHLPANKKIKIAAESNNLILKFEVLREVFYFNNTTLDLDDKILVKKIIIELSEDNCFWKQFLMFYLEYPLRSPKLFELLGKVLNQLNNKEIESFIERIKIDNHLSYECKSALNLCFFNIEDEPIQQVISKRLFERWLKFTDDYDEYTGSLLLTNVIDIVIHYVNNFLEDDEIIKAIDLIIENLQELNNKWFEDETRQSCSFYRLMSKLFIYGVAANTRMIDRKILIQNICDTNLILKGENHYNKKTTKALFSEFILTPEFILLSRDRQCEAGNQALLDWKKSKEQICHQIDHLPPS